MRMLLDTNILIHREAAVAAHDVEWRKWMTRASTCGRALPAAPAVSAAAMKTTARGTGAIIALQAIWQAASILVARRYDSVYT
jgi:hypothetical protein